MRRGVTLLELLTALIIAGFLVVGLTSSFYAAVQYEIRAPQARNRNVDRYAFEDRVRSWLAAAYLSSDPNDQNSYFIGLTGEGLDNGGSQGAPGLTWTAIGERPSGAAMASVETDFEARNESFGAVGGLSEISISDTPVGESAPADLSATFVREQKPADSDPDQGGYEKVLSDRATQITFEFYDGQEWLTEWDTRNGNRALPYAVRVRYVWDDDLEVPFQFVVSLNGDQINGANADSGATP